MAALEKLMEFITVVKDCNDSSFIDVAIQEIVLSSHYYSAKHKD
jgi:hypothetical protein